MVKRLSKTEYLVAYMIIISLACFVGGFFLGAKVMKSNLLAQQSAQAEAERQEKERFAPKNYSDQDFVAFYYSVLRPAQSFAEKHAQFLSVTADGTSRDATDAAEELRSAAEQARQEIAASKVPATSPLLIRAKEAYGNSLKAYLDALDRFEEARKDGRPASFRAFLDDFQALWLRAQADLYKAVSVWEELYVTKKRMPEEPAATYTFDQWKSFPFHYRNYLAAEMLARQKRMMPFRPEDLTVHIDNLVFTNQVGALGWKDVPQAMRVLIATNAVRSGDFKTMKGQLYPDLQSPQMPIFTE